VSAIEVLSASSVGELPDELRGAQIEGTEKTPGGLTVVGWALGADTAVEGVEVLHAGRVVARAGLGAPRPDAALAYPDLAEARNCGFRVPVESDGLTDEFELAVQAVLEGEGRIPIGLVRGRKVISFEALLGGHVDGIEQAWNQITVLGWALAGEVPVSAVEVSHDGRVVAKGELGVARPDIVEAYPTAPNARDSGFSITFPAADVPEEFQLEVTALLQDGGRVALGQVSGRRKLGGGWDPTGVQQTTPTLKPQLRELILRSAAEAGLHDLQVPEPESAGAWQRPSSPVMNARLSVLEQLDLQGKRVLELDSGLGELSRTVAASGAALVDGFERDPGMVGIARLLNAYHGATRISFFCRDAADQASYEDTYDVVLALGAVERLGPSLEAAAGATDGIFVAELDPADSQTSPMLEQLWPYRRTLLGREGGAAPGSGGAPPSMLTVALARDEDALRSCLEPAGDHEEYLPPRPR
jgi:hypothetical protein